MNESEARRIFRYAPTEQIGKGQLVERYGPLRENAPDDFKAKVDEALEVLMKVVA